MNRKLAMRVLTVIRVLCTDEAVTDTIWMPDSGVGVTACEELAEIASKLGATDAEIETVFMYLELPTKE
jgi:hypothetical protein